MEANSTLVEQNFSKLRALMQQLLANHSAPFHANGTGSVPQEDLDVNTDVYSKVLVTTIYVLLFMVGCLGKHNESFLTEQLFWPEINEVKGGL